MPLSRRALLRTASAVPVVALLAGCGSSGSGTTTATDEYIALGAAGLKSLLGYLNLSGSTLVRYQGYIDDLSALAQKVASGASSGSSVAKQVIDDLTAAIEIASGLTSNATAKTIISAIDALLPVFEALLGAVSARRHAMTPEMGAAYLRTLRH